MIDSEGENVGVLSPRRRIEAVRVVDETLRDGLQSAGVRDPSLDEKVRLLHAMAEIGVDTVSVGLPAAGERAARDVAELARAIVASKLRLRPTAAARTTEGDVHAIAEASARAGTAIEVYAFVGASPIRHLVEGVDTPRLVSRIEVAARAARRAGLRFCLVTEDTTRSSPDVLRLLFRAAIDAGAARLCLCDTVGCADPHGTMALVTFARRALAEAGAAHIELDWHGHNDRGLALANALAALRAGIDGVHGTALGVGERTGNTRIEHLLLAMADREMRRAPDEGALARYAELAEAALLAPAAPAASFVRASSPRELGGPSPANEAPSSSLPRRALPAYR
jgi:2-isopropylmalate synthase